MQAGRTIDEIDLVCRRRHCHGTVSRDFKSRVRHTHWQAVDPPPATLSGAEDDVDNPTHRSEIGDGASEV